ncbi:MAG: zinc-dependent alcohol dehydrogenase family protein [Ornithinimicrobium sp.]
MNIEAAVLTTDDAPAPYAHSQPLHVAHVELDGPGRGELLLRIRAAGLCHSDLSVMNGDRPRGLPLVLGHEAAGIVEAVGEGVTSFAEGDHVVMAFVPSCGDCLPCQSGRPALCEPGAAANAEGTLLGGGRRLHRGGEQLNHHLGVSCFADHAVISAKSCIKISEELPFEHAALFGCAVLTGVGAVINTAAMTAGSSAAVVGLGGVGLSALLGAIASGAREVVAVDTNLERLEFARELGATHTLDSSDEDAVEHFIRDHGKLEYVFEMAGAVPALQTAYALTGRGGTTVTAGLPHPDATLTIKAVTLTAEERTLKGSYIGTAVPRRDVPRYVSLFEAGRLPVDRLVTHSLALEDLNEGFDRLASGDAIRQIVQFD